MSFEEAVEIVKNYSANGLLLDGLEAIAEELNGGEEEPFWLSHREIVAYRVVCNKMRPLFH